MSKKILFSLMAILLAVGLVGAGAFAYFNDTETSEDNTLTAGTLDVKIDWEDDPEVFAFNFDNMKPGDKGCHTFRIQNRGTLPGTLTISVGPYTEAGGLNPEPEIVAEGEGNTPNLDDELYILMCRDNNCDPGCEGDMPTTLNGKVSHGLSQTDPTDVYTYPLSAGHQICVTLCYEVQDDADDINKIMGDSVAFDIVFTLEQTP